MPQGHHANDHQHPTAHYAHEDKDEFFAAPQQATPEELGWRSLEPTALVLARQRRIESGLFLARFRRLPLVRLRLRLELRFALVLFES